MAEMLVALKENLRVVKMAALMELPLVVLTEVQMAYLKVVMMVSLWAV